MNNPAGVPAVYVGTLSHRRYGPGTAHRFSYRLAMPYLDVANVNSAMSAHPLWSSSHPAPVWYRRADYLGDPHRPVDAEVRDVVEARTGARPDGPVMVLTHLRTWGWLFNPITMYFCFSADGSRVQNLLADVENTPWHEHHHYVLGPPGEHVVAKAMHVSPFLPMQATYRIRYSAPGDSLRTIFVVEQGETRLFEAVLSLRRHPFTRHELTRLMTRYPAVAHKVSAGIYAQAARLAIKGAPFFRHPADRGPAPGRLVGTGAFRKAPR